MDFVTRLFGRPQNGDARKAVAPPSTDAMDGVHIEVVTADDTDDAKLLRDADALFKILSAHEVVVDPAAYGGLNNYVTGSDHLPPIERLGKYCRCDKCFKVKRHSLETPFWEYPTAKGRLFCHACQQAHVLP